MTGSPEDAALMMDGQSVGNPTEQPFRYYGTVELRALPPTELTASPSRQATTRFHEVQPPAPKWLFPLDFFIELAGLPFRGYRDGATSIEMLPDPDVITPEQVPGGEPMLRERSAAARYRR